MYEIIAEQQSNKYPSPCYSVLSALSVANLKENATQTSTLLMSGLHSPVLPKLIFLMVLMVLMARF